MVQSVLRNKKETLVDRHIMHPEREWLLGIVTGVVLVAVVAYASIATYIKYSSVSVTSTEVTEGATVYRTELVAVALSEINSRSQEYENLKASILASDTFSATEITPTNTDTASTTVENTPADVQSDSEVVATSTSQTESEGTDITETASSTDTEVLPPTLAI